MKDGVLTLVLPKSGGSQASTYQRRLIGRCFTTPLTP
jgi:hypothetical protein